MIGYGSAIGWWIITSTAAAAGEQPSAPVHEAGSVRPVVAAGQPDEAATAAETPVVEGHLAETDHHAENHQAHAEDHHAAAGAGHGDGHGDGHGASMGNDLPFWSVVPFAILLGCVAVFPLVNPHWWEHNHNKGIIAALLAIPTAAYLAAVFGHAGIEKLEHAAVEYVSFIVLLGCLFVISGGVYIRGSFAGTPVVNTIFLAIGTVIASFIGTTGASMVLIRPLLRANARRTSVAHVVVFFIFAVSNCGGLLTPLGDPPLFMGFLAGVPFNWTFRLWPQWLLVNGLILAAFFVWDTIVARREEKRTAPAEGTPSEAFGIEGALNLAFLAAIVAIIYVSGNGIGNGGMPWEWYVRDPIMLATAALAFVTTSGAIREKNRFTFGPIIEVAVLFAGIFVTMIPALAILNAKGDQLGVNEPWQFFWASGMLSSFLDNAPTYLAFSAAACGMENVPLSGPYMLTYLQLPAASNAAAILAAISCGAVFMGANTYIGNGPNFMVKAIAEENNVQMPSFFGYMAYSVSILVPIFVVVTFVFFR